MQEKEIAGIVRRQKAYFAEGRTLPVPCRLAALGRLERSVRAHQEDIAAALQADLGKSPQESYMCETGLTLAELRDHRAHLRRWAQPRVRLAGAANFPGLAARVPGPYGVALIMAPWNYPFLLTLEPLIGAVAAGNCAVVKPSAYAPASSALLARMIRESFPPGHVTVVEGGRAENTALLDQAFDTIFFTGSVAVGRMVMEKAAAHLTPVTLELGGKSPCIVTVDADLALAARRIVFGKLLNCGQTCVAPDYLLVDVRVKEELTARIKAEIRRQYGPRPLQNPAYGRIVNQKHFRRLCGLPDGASRVWGGERDADAWRIAPALLEDASPREPAMQEEIFGPLLPVLSYRRLEEALDFVRSRPKPLALYLFTRSRAVRSRVVRTVPYGGGCVNDTIMHLSDPFLPFGGVGQSGMGSYHGKRSFDTFTHEKSVLVQGSLDLPIRYQPYTPLGDKLVRAFLR